MASWDLGQFIAAKSVITWEQLIWGCARLTMHGLYPYGVSEKLTRMNLCSARKTWQTGDYDNTAILRAWVALWNSALWNILEPEQLGPGKCIRQRAHLGLCSGRTPGHFRLGRAGDAWLNWDWAVIEHPEIWAAWALEVQETKIQPGTVPQQKTGESGLLGPGKSKRYMVQLGLGLHRTPWNLSSLDLGSAGDTQPTWDCTPSTGCTLGSLGLGSAGDTWPSCDCALTGHPGASVVGSEKWTLPWTLADSVLSIHYKGSPQIPAIFVCSVPASSQHNRANDPE